MIKILQNPKTEEYKRLKQHILSNNFPWYYKKQTTNKTRIGNTNISFFSHLILSRPEENGYSVSFSGLTDDISSFILKSLKENNINLITFLRINVNLVYPHSTVVNTVPHIDHPYKHKNLLIYLTDAGGKTIVEGEEHDPQEDDMIVFQGEHYHQTPERKLRVVIVATFIDEEILA